MSKIYRKWSRLSINLKWCSLSTSGQWLTVERNMQSRYTFLYTFNYTKTYQYIHFSYTVIICGRIPNKHIEIVKMFQAEESRPDDKFTQIRFSVGQGEVGLNEFRWCDVLKVPWNKYRGITYVQKWHLYKKCRQYIYIVIAEWTSAFENKTNWRGPIIWVVNAQWNGEYIEAKLFMSRNLRTKKCCQISDAKHCTRSMKNYI